MNIIITEEEILKTPNDWDLASLVREKYWRIKYQSKGKFDKCVICLKDSPYTPDVPSSERIGYVEGGGQGCFNENRCKVY